MIITYSTSKKKKKQEEEDIAPVKQTENKNKSTNTGFGSIGVLPTIKKSANVFLGNSTKEKAKEVFNNSNLGRTKNAIQGLFSDGYDFGDVTKSILLARSNLNRTLNPGYKIGENIAKTGEKIYTDIKEGKGNEYIQNAKPIQNIKSRFSDGWDAGDVTKSILDVNKLALGTSADILANLAKGELQTAEGLVDTGRYVVSDVAKLAGADKLSAYAKQNAIQNTTGFIFGENDSQNNMKENGWLSKLDQYSLFGNQMDNIIQSVGQQGFRYGLATAGKMTGLGETGEKILNNVEIFAGSYGSAKSQAYMQGADDKTATVRGIISGTAEWVSEHLDENPFLKTGSVTSKLKGNIVKGIEKTFGSELMGKIALAAMSAESEDFEERLSNALETMGTDIYNYIDADYKYGLEEGQGLDKNASAWDNVKKSGFI